MVASRKKLEVPGAGRPAVDSLGSRPAQAGFPAILRTAHFAGQGPTRRLQWRRFSQLSKPHTKRSISQLYEINPVRIHLPHALDDNQRYEFRAGSAGTRKSGEHQQSHPAGDRRPLSRDRYARRTSAGRVCRNSPKRSAAGKGPVTRSGKFLWNKNGQRPVSKLPKPEPALMNSLDFQRRSASPQSAASSSMVRRTIYAACWRCHSTPGRNETIFRPICISHQGQRRR